MQHFPTIEHNSGDTRLMVSFNYFDVAYAIKVYDFIIQTSGGLFGVKDEGLIESVLVHMRNDAYYPEFLDKLTHIVFGLNKNHAFLDGNKRTSIALSAFFLELNGHDFALPQYQHGMEEVVVWIAKGLIGKDTLKDIIEFLVYDTPLNVVWFIEQAKRFRPFIEPMNQPISAELLKQMVYDWLGTEMCLSEETLLQLLEVLDITS